MEVIQFRRDKNTLADSRRLAKTLKQKFVESGRTVRAQSTKPPSQHLETMVETKEIRHGAAEREENFIN